MKKTWDSIWINGVIATGDEHHQLVNHGAVAVKDGLIAWVGEMVDLPNQEEYLAEEIYDVNGNVITPGLIDCHTHLVYAGNRALEFEKRLQGASYEEIARSGGGIQSTVAATRAATEDELLEQSLKRARSMLAQGVTTIEIKSGYGLNLETELKILRVAKRIEELLPLTVKKTFLGAHTIPAEYKEKADEYVDLVCNEMIPVVAKEKLADAVDVFCETIAFNLQQTEKIFKTATQYGLAIKCHAEQLSSSGAATLAAKYNALSVDHLEHLSEANVSALSSAKTVAVLLPGAFYFLRETKTPPIQLLRNHQIPIAIATDCNPGTSPVTSLPQMLNMACVLFRLTPDEALAGATGVAARALGLDDRGVVSVGKIADLVVWDAKHPVELSYSMSGVGLKYLIKKGKVMIL